jgi:Ca-activated chloride channel homolog
MLSLREEQGDVYPIQATPRQGGQRAVRTIRQLPPALLLALLAALAQARTPAQTKDTPTLQITTNLVAVSAIVRDKSNQPVPNLTRDDLALKEDGKPQAIRYFSQGSTLPLTLALLVDTSGSQRAYIRDEIAAGNAFFPALLSRPDDRAVLVQFDTDIVQLARLTTSVRTLEDALAYLSQSHNDLRAYSTGGGTLLYDAIVSVSKIELGPQFGRRAMVLLTDGGDEGSKFSQKAAIEAAQRAGIMVYSVYYSNGGGDLDGLTKMSKATGGRVFIVGPQLTLQQIYAAIAADMRQEYEIGYIPPKSKANKYHKIDLTAVNKSLTVQAREGYFTPK